MGHKIAKLILEHADSFLERTEAVDVAMSLGMTLDEIQDYLDWIDSLDGKKASPPSLPAGEQAQQKDTARHDDNLPAEDS